MKHMVTVRRAKTVDERQERFREFDRGALNMPNGKQPFNPETWPSEPDGLAYYAARQMTDPHRNTNHVFQNVIVVLIVVVAAVFMYLFLAFALPRHGHARDDGRYANELQPGDLVTTDCQSLLRDKSFKPSDCLQVFAADDPLDAAEEIKCGDKWRHGWHDGYGYWTAEELTVNCVEPPERRSA